MDEASRKRVRVDEATITQDQDVYTSSSDSSHGVEQRAKLETPQQSHHDGSNVDRGESYEDIVGDHANFGLFVWNDISILLFYRMRQLIHGSMLALVQAPDLCTRKAAVDALEQDLKLVWDFGRRHLPATERHALHKHVKCFMTALVCDVRNVVLANTNANTAIEATVIDVKGVRPPVLVRNDVFALGRAVQRLLEEHGFPEEELGELSRFLADARQAAEPNCYSYSERPSLQLPLLVRLDTPPASAATSPIMGPSGTNRKGGGVAFVSEKEDGAFKHPQQQSLPQGALGTSVSLPLQTRVSSGSIGSTSSVQPTPLQASSSSLPVVHREGHVVELPHPHPHPEVNTLIQLMEPRKRKPNLDEYRIFSHPKRTATHASEDFIVDEELTHRALVVLTTHLDTYGSLRDLSPYARFLLWNVLERDDEVFNFLYEQPQGSSNAARGKLEALREELAKRRAAFDAVRKPAREAALLIGWYAVSAQWRDQVLSKLSDIEEGDWQLVGEVARIGGTAIFPNYAQAPAVCTLALGIIKKMDRVFADDDTVPCVTDVVNSLLLPLLCGTEPELDDFCFSSPYVRKDSSHFTRVRRRLRTLLQNEGSNGAVTTTGVPQNALVTTSSGAKVSSSKKTGASAKGEPLRSDKYDEEGESDEEEEETPRTIHSFLCASLVYPLQCLAELLDLCSLALYSVCGIDAFTRSFLAVAWEDEEGILSYLLKREPMNPAIAPLVTAPRLYKELVTGLQLLARDKMLPYCVEARKMAAESAAIDLTTRNYTYWKALCITFEEERRQDDLILLIVNTAEQPEGLGVTGQRWYTEATIERAPKVWQEDLIELREEEDRYRQSVMEGSASSAQS